MPTIILTYRNRTITLVKNCLESLLVQSDKDFRVIFVDYGSSKECSYDIRDLTSDYNFVDLIQCCVAGQLWNKSRAINIALDQVNTDFVFIGDVDIIFSPVFIASLKKFRNPAEAVYFPVGFLSRDMCATSKSFNEYTAAHISTEGATGMTLYPSQLLKEINGYDEFYHGWGSEDTDVHIRLRNAGYRVLFEKTQLLLLHQWHPKTYRTKNSTEPFHSGLEAINAAYLTQAATTGRGTVNVNFERGRMPDIELYAQLKQPVKKINLTNLGSEVEALVIGGLDSFAGIPVCIEINAHKQYRTLKNSVKQLINRKPLRFLSFEEANNKILELVISRYRSSPYSYSFNRQSGHIRLVIIP